VKWTKDNKIYKEYKSREKGTPKIKCQSHTNQGAWQSKIIEKWQAVTTTILLSGVVAVTNHNEQNFFTRYGHSASRNRRIVKGEALAVHR